MVPLGVAGTEQALPQGAKFVYRSRVEIVVGEPLPAPEGTDGKRVGRDQLRAFTAELTTRLQHAQNTAVEQASKTSG